ncbi:hypothetical protein M408DRAFT_328492 [Serendipita vermifera MAFF 305830]|uniref:Uncharacterized protein n=1 Tax=Serendipita vermifera MAFF 305830 TaxID=933852 RepID=A0A0C3BF97_SERVB|nr:hypothetical protein M408DRAFT_328492 [Serendipita vermifera MAFF 305830]
MGPFSYINYLTERDRRFITEAKSVAEETPVDLRRAKVAIITGASSGIGRVTAIALCKAGWTVVLSARRETELQETARLCAEARASEANEKVALVVPGDVTKEEDVKTLFIRTMDEYGRVDLLFNNAGISGQSLPLEEIPLSNIEAVLQINVLASIICTQYAIATFKNQTPKGGRIINNGSLAAHVPRPHGSIYAISKHAILGLTKATSLEGRAHNIACTQIDVGNAMTQMAAETANEGALQPDGSTRTEPAIDAKHIANSIVHIASLPLDVTVLEMNIMATGMPYVGRG